MAFRAVFITPLRGTCRSTSCIKRGKTTGQELDTTPRHTDLQVSPVPAFGAGAPNRVGRTRAHDPARMGLVLIRIK